jgi:subtilisin family serine protease
MTITHCKLAHCTLAQWTIVLKAKCFVRRPLIALLPLLAISLATSAFAASDPVAALAKIEPHLASTIAFGGNNEALIILGEQADLSGASSLPTKLQKGIYVYNALRAVAERSQAPLRKMLQDRGIPFQSFYSVNVIKINASRDQIYEIAGRDEVLRIEANPHVRSTIPVASGMLSTVQQTQGVNTAVATPGVIEWNVQRVNAPQAWALGYNGQGMVVAGADTGVMWNHASLINHYRGWNGTTANHSYNWHDATSAHSATPVDPQYHGTFTMSEMVGDDGVGNQVGVAPGAKWIACRNMDQHGVGSPSQYIECFDWIMAPYPMGQPQLANPAMAPDVVNNSWDCPASEGCDLTTLTAAVTAVQAAGIFESMAAGNYGSACGTVETTPAIFASAVSVGATDSYNSIAPFSSRGPVTVDGSNRLKPEIVAPGLNIRGAIAYTTTSYQNYWSGTSMAAPHVAGAVAILWQAKHNLIGNIPLTLQYLTQNATQYTSTQNCGSFRGTSIPNAVFGYGLLNILKAVQAP